eukprot:SM000001S04661  [mRNA]  locus=s1:1534572:1536993:- [translate_table: standard]
MPAAAAAAAAAALARHEHASAGTWAGGRLRSSSSRTRHTGRQAAALSPPLLCCCRWIVGPQITFSKRRNGLIKKASELSVLCGCDVAVILFSPTGKYVEFCSCSMPDMLARSAAQQADVQAAPGSSSHGAQAPAGSDAKRKLDNTGGSDMLNKQVKRLQHEVESHRRQLLRMAGEELGGLPVSDLDELESALEGSMRRIRQRKHDLMAAEILRLRQALESPPQRQLQLPPLPPPPLAPQPHHFQQQLPPLTFQSPGAGGAGGGGGGGGDNGLSMMHLLAQPPPPLPMPRSVPLGGGMLSVPMQVVEGLDSQRQATVQVRHHWRWQPQPLSCCSLPRLHRGAAGAPLGLGLYDLAWGSLEPMNTALNVQRGGASSPLCPPAPPLGGGGSGGGGNRRGNGGAAAAMAPLGEVARLNVTLPGAQRLPQLVTLQSPSSATAVERDRSSAAAPPGLEGYLQLQLPPPPPASPPTQQAAPSTAAAQMLFR